MPQPREVRVEVPLADFEAGMRAKLGIEDLRAVRFWVDPEHNVLCLVLASETFATVPAGIVPPRIEVPT